MAMSKRRISRFTPDIVQKILESTQEGFWLIGTDVVTIDVNPAMCAMLGRPRAAIIGRPIFDFVDDENARIFEREIAARKAGKKGSYEIALLQPDGRLRPCINNAIGVFDDDGERIASVGIWTDVSDLKHAQLGLHEAQALLEARVTERTSELEQRNRQLIESEDRLRDFAESASDWFWETDCEHRFTFLSERIRDVTGHGPERFLGKRRDAITTDDADAPHWRRHLNDLALHKPFRDFVYTFDGADGREHTISVNGTPVFGADGAFAGYRGTVSDITDRVRMERARNEALKLAETANHEKSKFLANISHEIRTPLNSIIGFSQAITSGAFGKVQNPTHAEYLRNIQYSGEHLLSLINDVLDVAKLETGAVDVHPERLRTHEAVRHALDLVVERMRGIGLELETDIHDGAEWLYADPRHVRQILLNLLTNAVKFTPRDGAITIEARPAANGCVALSVADTGIGIPEDMQDSVFQPFTQVAGAYTRNHEGSGLGLSISRSLAELNGGRLGLESAVGAGTTVTLTLPATAPAPAPGPAPG
jgi:PAS domain S-box-containing protein